MIADTALTAGLLVAAFAAGTVREPVWVPVVLGDIEYQVATAPLLAEVDGESLFLPVSLEEQEQLYRERDWVPPTYGLCVAMFGAATRRLQFEGLVTADPKTNPVLYAQQSAAMLRVEYTRRITAHLLSGLPPDESQLAFGPWKLWILDALQASRGAVNHGFWNLAMNPARPVQSRGAAHDRKHRDYSQLAQPVKRYARRVSTGASVDLLDEWVRSPHAVPSRFLDAYRRERVSPQARSAPPASEPAQPELRRGDRGKGVQRLQLLLNERCGAALDTDGIFGAMTSGAVASACAAAGIRPADGVCRAELWQWLAQPRASSGSGGPDGLAGVDRFIEAAVRRPRQSGYGVDLIIIHTMETPEGAKTAEAVAKWFAGPNHPQASAHFCIDARETIQCVRLSDQAAHAPGANTTGLGIEHAGRASQSSEDWEDPYSSAMLARSARLAAELCNRYGIPVQRLSIPELQSGARGFAGHVDVSLAWRKSTHTDPGTAFPWARYLAAVRGELERLLASAPRE